MKISKRWIILVVVVAVLFVANQLGINVGGLLFILLLASPIVIIYGLIEGVINKFADALANRRAVGNEEINAKTELMMQRMQVIENKVDKINTILEKVSD